MAPVRMSSEAAPVSEPVYDYLDDKHVPAAAACVESSGTQSHPNTEGKVLVGRGDSDEYDLDLIYRSVE